MAFPDFEALIRLFWLDPSTISPFLVMGFVFLYLRPIIASIGDVVLVLLCVWNTFVISSDRRNVAKLTGLFVFTLCLNGLLLHLLQSCSLWKDIWVFCVMCLCLILCKCIDVYISFLVAIRHANRFGMRWYHVDEILTLNNGFFPVKSLRNLREECRERNGEWDAYVEMFIKRLGAPAA